MQLIEKWLLKVEDGELVIISKPVNKYTPVNRILEDVGFYYLGSVTVKVINGKAYR